MGQEDGVLSSQVLRLRAYELGLILREQLPEEHRLAWAAHR